jgi:hypothetical protein
MPRNLWQPGQSGNAGGRPRGSRNQLSEAVICALLRDFRLHGQKAIAQVRRTQPGVYVKIMALLVPREHRVEHVDPVTQLSDETLEQVLSEMQARLEARARDAKLVNGKAKAIETPPALPASDDTEK